MASLRPLFSSVRRPMPALPYLRHASSTSRTSDGVIPVNQAQPDAGVPNVSSTNATPVSTQGTTGQAVGDSSTPGTVAELPAKGEERRVRQAPNRQGVWSRSQNPRGQAMVGPRFEQTIIELQPQPEAAIDLIHKQPVRWTDQRVVACDGGGGPLGHPRIFVNVDKPQICWCTYCGVPYAHNHHRKYLESLPKTSYPLEPTNQPEVVHESQRLPQGGAFEQR